MRDESFKEFVLDQLRGLEGVAARPMFGGHGLYCGDRFFGILFKGRLYFKTTPATRPKYLQAGMKPFAPNKQQTLKSYYEVPVDIIESADQLAEWGREAARDKAEL